MNSRPLGIGYTLDMYIFVHTETRVSEHSVSVVDTPLKSEML